MTSFGPWVVERPIGRGGMATVYRCHRADAPERLAAVKVLHALDRDPARVARLARESRLLRRLDHPGIVRVLDTGLADDEPWLALELVDGAELGRARPGPRPPDEVAALGLALAEALAHAHQLGVWHRDVKPANVLVERTGTVRLVDFGIASSTDEADPEKIAPGTLPYAPPEWFRSESPAPAPADAYGLGVVLHEQLTGTPAFPAKGGPAVVARAKDVPCLDPGDGVPAVLRGVIVGLTAADPRVRTPVAEALGKLAALRASRPSTEETPLPPPPRGPREPGDAFVGRTDELAAAERHLADGARVVVLVGPAGAGKTRIALRLAARARAAVADLSAVDDLEGYEVAVARALGVPLTEGDTGRQLERALVARGALVLVLDNLEHLVRHVPDTVSRWLAAAPELRIVATSQQRLRVAGERIVPIAPLPEADAAALFVARRREHDPDWVADPAEVARVIAPADGLPLAIELAAAPGGPRPTARHRSLDAALDAAWAPLSERERNVLAEVSVFEGPFGLDAAEAVCEELHEPATAKRAPARGEGLHDVLQGLVDRSLLAVRRGEGAFVLLRTVRDHAARALGAREAALRRRHAAFYAALAEAETRSQPPTASEVDNARAACRWAEEQGEVALALRTAEVLADAAFRVGPVLPALERVERVLALPGGPPADRLRLRIRHTGLLERSSRAADALAVAEAAVAEARAHGEPVWEGRTLAALARAGWMHRDPAATMALIAEALEKLTGRARPRDLALLLALRANVAYSLRVDLAQAREDAENAVRALQEDPDPYSLAMVLGVQALVSGKPLDAVIRLARRNGYPALHLDALCMAGIEATRNGKVDAAAIMLEQAWEGAARCGFLGRQADAGGGLAVVALRRHRFADAERWARQVMALRGEDEAHAHPNLCNQLGLAAAGRGRLDEAERWFRESDERSVKARVPPSLCVVIAASRATLLAELGHDEAAARALAIAERFGPVPPGSAAAKTLAEARAAVAHR